MQTQYTPFFKRDAGFWTVPTDEAKKGFFDQLTPIESQREDWYVVTPYVAEFWCTISNVGLLGVGLYHQSPELMCAAVASIFSHAIPKQWLLHIDKVAAFVAASKMIRDYRVLVHNPWLVLLIMGLGGVGLSDLYFARHKDKTMPHVVWHMCAAAVSHAFLRCV
jgi:hypothetical protein